MVLPPALGPEEPGDFSFAAAYSTLPASPSSPTPLPSTSWKPTSQSGRSSSATTRASPLQEEEAAASSSEHEVGTSRNVAERDSVAPNANGAGNGREKVVMTETPARALKQPGTSSADGGVETGSGGLKSVEKGAPVSTSIAVSREEAASTTKASPSHSKPEEGTTPGTTTRPVPAVKAPPPRKKVPFEKGYSQMDWLKLTQTHPDLAGLRGGPKRRIKMEEVRQHKLEDDSWTVLRGKVFNITPYFDFHPGGKKMLKLAAGKDSTDLFNKYHMWVNADFLLEKCWLGILDND